MDDFTNYSESDISSATNTVAALYKDHDQAKNAVDALVEAGYDRSSIDLTRNVDDIDTINNVDYVDDDLNPVTDQGVGRDMKPAQEHGFWNSIKQWFSGDDNDAHAYGEGVRRGGTLVTVHTSESQVGEVVKILDFYAPQDLDKSVEEWRSDGWETPNQLGVSKDYPDQLRTGYARNYPKTSNLSDRSDI